VIIDNKRMSDLVDDNSIDEGTVTFSLPPFPTLSVWFLREMLKNNLVRVSERDCEFKPFTTSDLTLFLHSTHPCTFTSLLQLFSSLVSGSSRPLQCQRCSLSVPFLLYSVPSTSVCRLLGSVSLRFVRRSIIMTRRLPPLTLSRGPRAGAHLAGSG
jgi:hypothetical protein